MCNIINANVVFREKKIEFPLGQLSSINCYSTSQCQIIINKKDLSIFVMAPMAQRKIIQDTFCVLRMDTFIYAVCSQLVIELSPKVFLNAPCCKTEPNHL